MDKVHRLKTWLIFFHSIVSGEKLFDIRKNDRDFQTGDIVHFCEWDEIKSEFTGRVAANRIGYILGGGWGLEPGYCAFMLIPVTRGVNYKTKADAQQAAYEVHEELKRTRKEVAEGG